MDIEKFARKDVQALTPYLSARRLGGNGDVWLNANESPFHNEYQINNMALNRYSECQPASLIQAYANYAGVHPEQVLTSRGADESIDLLIRTFCEAGEDAILFCPPTYGMYSISAETAGVMRKIVPLTLDWQLDLIQIQHHLEQVKLIFICSPNNPTGNLISRQSIENLLDLTAGKAFVVIDEAYIEFCHEASNLDLLSQYPHLIILRTLSKAFALAGLRCGFTLANPQVIQLMLKIIPPYPIPIPVTEIACQALSEKGLARMKHQVKELNENRAYLEAGLSMLQGIQVYQSYGNYLFVEFPDAEQIFSHLWELGIILRRSPIQNCIRITVGHREECEKTLTLIRQLMVHSEGT